MDLWNGATRVQFLAKKVPPLFRMGGPHHTAVEGLPNFPNRDPDSLKLQTSPTLFPLRIRFLGEPDMLVRDSNSSSHRQSFFAWTKKSLHQRHAKCKKIISLNRKIWWSLNITIYTLISTTRIGGKDKPLKDKENEKKTVTIVTKAVGDTEVYEKRPPKRIASLSSLCLEPSH